MNALNPILILLAAFFVVYFEASFSAFRNIAGAQIDLLPPLIVYAALTHSVGFLAILALCSGLWLDSLSANPLGVSVLPLFAVGMVIYHFRSLLLREMTYAQFTLGLMASAAVPALTVIALLTFDANPIFGWGSLWQWFVVTLLGGVSTPVIFRVFDWLQRALTYAKAAETSFRNDRDIKHGKHT